MSRKTEIAEVAGRRYWRDVDARIIVAAWQSSGETLSEFADRHGVDPKRIARWASRLERAKPAAMLFHPVRLAEDGLQSWSGPAIEIELIGHRRVRVAHGFEVEDLRRVLAVLEEGTKC
jgi:transposase-like protein